MAARKTRKEEEEKSCRRKGRGPWAGEWLGK